MGGGDAIFGAAGGHADQFQRAEVGRDEGQAGDPGRDGAAGGEEVRGGLHVARQGEADADDETDINEEDGVIESA